jgi:hypothetical protein
MTAADMPQKFVREFERIIRIVTSCNGRNATRQTFSKNDKSFGIVAALRTGVPEELEQFQSALRQSLQRKSDHAPLSMTILDISAMLLKSSEMQFKREILLPRIAGSSVITMTSLKNASTERRMEARERNASP